MKRKFWPYKRLREKARHKSTNTRLEKHETTFRFKSVSLLQPQLSNLLDILEIILLFPVNEFKNTLLRACGQLLFFWLFPRPIYRTMKTSGQICFMTQSIFGGDVIKWMSSQYGKDLWFCCFKSQTIHFCSAVFIA